MRQLRTDWYRIGGGTKTARASWQVASCRQLGRKKRSRWPPEPNRAAKAKGRRQGVCHVEWDRSGSCRAHLPHPVRDWHDYDESLTAQPAASGGKTAFEPGEGLPDRPLSPGGNPGSPVTHFRVNQDSASGTPGSPEQPTGSQIAGDWHQLSAPGQNGAKRPGRVRRSG